MLARHGWRLCTHPLFLDQIERLIAAVARAQRADPDRWRSKADAKLLAALTALVRERIPRDPLAAAFRQGNTLGLAHRHWFRAKFGANRFRLFFRADSRARLRCSITSSDSTVHNDATRLSATSVLWCSSGSPPRAKDGVYQIGSRSFSNWLTPPRPFSVRSASPFCSHCATIWGVQ